MLTKSCKNVNLFNSTPSLLGVKYHQQALFHNEVLFWVCLVAGSLILGIAIALVLHALLTPGVTFGLAAVDIGLGLLLKLVCALFYKEMKASRERTTELFDRIRQDDRMVQSTELVSKIPDERIRSTTMAKLALQIAADGGLSHNKSLTIKRRAVKSI
jgi:hypothetical protein